MGRNRGGRGDIPPNQKILKKNDVFSVHGRYFENFLRTSSSSKSRLELSIKFEFGPKSSFELKKLLNELFELTRTSSLSMMYSINLDKLNSSNF